MNTIKFQSWDEKYPIRERENSKFAKTISISEGKDIWHRPFLVKTTKEYAEWLQRFAFGQGEIESHITGEDPALALAEMEKHDDVNHGSVYFEYLTYRNSENEFHKCVIYCCEVFIMNAEGQTVDSFAA